MIGDFKKLLEDTGLSYNGITAEINKHNLSSAVVGTFYYGGDGTEKPFSKFKVIADEFGPLPINKIGTQIELYDIEGAVIRFLCLLDTSIKDITDVDRSPENRASIVSLWDTGKGKYLMMGDATVETMAHLNNVADKTNYVANVMTAPHHGADLTSRGYLKAKGVDADNGWQIYRKFLSNYEPQGVAISAGYNNTHGHPGRNFLDATYCHFSKNNKVNETDHSIYANLDETVKKENRRYGLYETKAPIYSILQKNDKDGNLYFRALQYRDSSHTPEADSWSNQYIQAPSEVYDSSQTNCANIKTKQFPFDYKKNNKNISKSPAAGSDRPRAIKRGRAS